MIIQWTVILVKDVREAAHLRLVSRKSPPFFFTVVSIRFQGENHRLTRSDQGLFDYESLEALFTTGAFVAASPDGSVKSHRFPVPLSYQSSYDDAKIIPFLARFISRNPLPGCPISDYFNELVSRILPGADENTRLAALCSLCYQTHLRYTTSQVPGRLYSGHSHVPGWETGIVRHLTRLPASSSAYSEEDFRTENDAAIASVLLKKFQGRDLITALNIPEGAWVESKLFGTALYAAACTHGYDLARHLLSHANCHSISPSTYCDLLKAAIRNDDLRMVMLIMDPRGGCPRSGETLQLAIIEAARFGRAAILRYLLVHLSKTDGRLALQAGLWWATLRSYVEVTRVLVLERGVDANSTCVWNGQSLDESAWNMSPLMLTAWAGHEKLLRFFLRANTKNEWRRNHAGQYFQAAITGNRVNSIKVIFQEVRTVKGVRMPTTNEWARLLAEGLQLRCTDAVHYLLREEKVLGWPGDFATKFTKLPAAMFDLMHEACSLRAAATVSMLLEAGVRDKKKGLLCPTARAPDEAGGEGPAETFVSHRPWINVTVTCWRSDSGTSTLT